MPKPCRCRRHCAATPSPGPGTLGRGAPAGLASPALAGPGRSPRLVQPQAAGGPPRNPATARQPSRPSGGADGPRGARTLYPVGSSLAHAFPPSSLSAAMWRCGAGPPRHFFRRPRASRPCPPPKGTALRARPGCAQSRSGAFTVRVECARDRFLSALDRDWTARSRNHIQSVPKHDPQTTIYSRLVSHTCATHKSKNFRALWKTNERIFRFSRDCQGESGRMLSVVRRHVRRSAQGTHVQNMFFNQRPNVANDSSNQRQYCSSTSLEL